MNKIFKVVKYILFAVLIAAVCLFISANLVNLIAYNDAYLELEPEFLRSLYYLLPAVFALGISILLYFINRRLNKYGLVQAFLFCFANTYLFTSIFMLWLRYCDKNKNLDLTHTFIALALVIIATVLLLTVFFSYRTEKANPFKYISVIASVLIFVGGFLSSDISVYLYQLFLISFE